MEARGKRTRGWTLSTFMGCCVWILHGLGAAAAIPVTAEERSAAGTASPTTAESEGPGVLLMGTVETTTAAADAERAESIVAGTLLTPSLLPGTEADALLSAASEYGPTAPTLMNVTNPLNTSQDSERASAAPAAATTATSISAQHPAVTPEAELGITAATPDSPLGTTPLFADAQKDILETVTREGAEDLDPTADTVSVATIPPAAAWEAQPTADSPSGASATALPSQGLTTTTGAAKENVIQPVDVQSESSANSSSSSPGDGDLLTAQNEGTVDEAVSITPEPAEETLPAVEESPLDSVPADTEDAVNSEFSTASSSQLPPESPAMPGTVGSPGEHSILPGQAVPSPDTLLEPASHGDGDKQGAPGASLEAPGSALSPETSEVPVVDEVTEDTATSLLGPRVPTDAQGNIDAPVPATALPTEDAGSMTLTKPSLQSTPWQTSTGEEPQLPSSSDIPSPPEAANPPLGAANPPVGAGASTFPAADDGAETPANPDLSTAPGVPVSPSLGGSQPQASGAPQEADELDTGLISPSSASSPATFVPDGLAGPTVGFQGQGIDGAADMALTGGPVDGSPNADTQSETIPSTFSTQQDPTNTGELPAADTGALANAELSPPSVPEDGTGAVPALGQVLPPGPAMPSGAGLKPSLSGAERPGVLPGESATAPGPAYPPPGPASSPVFGAGSPATPDLGAVQGAPEPPSFEGFQPWGTAAGSPPGVGLPGANRPGMGLNSPWDGPNSGGYGPAGPPSPGLGDQLSTNLGLPAVEGHGAGTAEQVLGGAGSGTVFEPSLSSAAGSGTAAGVDQLPGAGSLSGPASPSGGVAASSISEGNEAGATPTAAFPGPDSLAPASPDSETGSELTLVPGAEGTGDAAQAGIPESPSAFSTQQDPTNTGEMPAADTGALANAELSPPSVPEDGTGAVPALGQVLPPGPAMPSGAGLKPSLSGAERPGVLPGESATAPGPAYPPPGPASSPVFGAGSPATPDLGAVQGAPEPPSFEGFQPWGTAAGSPPGVGLPGANRPGMGLNSPWDGPNSGGYGPAGPPSPGPGDQLSTNLGLPAVEGHSAGTAEQLLGGAGSGTVFEPSLSSAAGSGTAAGVDQLPGAGSLSGPASPSGGAAASSILDLDSPSAFGGVSGAPGALQPSLGAGLDVYPNAEVAAEVPGDGGSPGQSQTPASQGPAGSGPSDRETASVLQTASSSSSAEGSSSPGVAGEATNVANLPGAGGAGSGLSTGLQAAGPEEHPVSAPGIHSGADLGISGERLRQDNLELPEGASVNEGPVPGASVGEDAGSITQMTSGVLAPPALASSQVVQPLVPVAPVGSGASDRLDSSPAASLLLPGQGLSSGLAPSGDPRSASGTQSGSRPLLPGAQGQLAEDAGRAQTWSLEDEVASGMPAPLGKASPYAPAPLNAAPALSSALQREKAAEGLSANPGLSAPLSASESIVGSSAGGVGQLGAVTSRGAAPLLPPHQSGNPSGESSSPMPGEAARGDMAQLLPSATRAEAAVGTLTHSSLGGTPGLPGLPPARITPGSSRAETVGPASAGASSSTALQPNLGQETTTNLANGASAAGESSHLAAFPGKGGARGGSPTTTHPSTSCIPATTSVAPPFPLLRDREVLPRLGAATVTSQTPSPVFPALPGRPVATLTPLLGPTGAAVPLYAYGARDNDREYVERRVDFNSPLFKPETGFPFGKTLRDSLYFTDNGQIVFPSSDNGIFTYPSPPPRGFNGHEEVPMIAVFWDNADFSRGIGTTYYQEYLTLNTAKPPFVRDVEAKIRRYLKSSYSAAWTLKITWEKAPAYAAWTDTRRTITYQAVLTTDGFRSYILMLYQQGGMQWDYTKLAATNVLIGYTSGDGFYRNDDLTKGSPATKYRPDQFRGYNTDLRGFWIYKLESRVGVNYRLKCLAWTGRQQEPREWSHGLPTCPCSLQQGQQDPRFKSSRGGWWSARVSMLYSASPNQHGASVRCLYDSQNQLIEGRQERYWRSSRQASPYRDQELKFYDWCCNQSGSARLCARYSEKRPRMGCDGYQSPEADEDDK